MVTMSNKVEKQQIIVMLHQRMLMEVTQEGQCYAMQSEWFFLQELCL